MRLLEDGEDGSDGDEAVDVGAAVQGVEGDYVLPLALRLHFYLIVILLRPDSSTLCKDTRPAAAAAWQSVRYTTEVGLLCYPDQVLESKLRHQTARLLNL